LTTPDIWQRGLFWKSQSLKAKGIAQTIEYPDGLAELHFGFRARGKPT
jgi:hypothetical protein